MQISLQKKIHTKYWMHSEINLCEYRKFGTDQGKQTNWKDLKLFLWVLSNYGGMISEGIQKIE